jgi:hypothetical protein
MPKSHTDRLTTSYDAPQIQQEKGTKTRSTEVTHSYDTRETLSKLWNWLSKRVVTRRYWPMKATGYHFAKSTKTSKKGLVVVTTSYAACQQRKRTSRPTATTRTPSLLFSRRLGFGLFCRRCHCRARVLASSLGRLFGDRLPYDRLRKGPTTGLRRDTITYVYASKS